MNPKGKADMALDDRLLEAYIHRFCGFGTYNGSIWLVGMEEGGGWEQDDVARRLTAWDARGRLELDDVAEFSAAARLGDYFTPTGRLVPVFRGVLRVLLHAQGRPVTTDTVKAYQRAELGRADGDDCVLELMPLPSPGVDQWHYREWSNLDYLQDRKRYMSHVRERRVRHLRDRISQYRPRLVLFYGLGYRAWWEQIAGTVLDACSTPGAYVARNPDTIFMMVKQPVAVGVKNADFDAAGMLAAELLGPPH